MQFQEQVSKLACPHTHTCTYIHYTYIHMYLHPHTIPYYLFFPCNSETEVVKNICSEPVNRCVYCSGVLIHHLQRDQQLRPKNKVNVMQFQTVHKSHVSATKQLSNICAYSPTSQEMEGLKDYNTVKIHTVKMSINSSLSL